MRLALITHDAGGANFLAALADRHSRSFDWLVLVAGPAHDILARVFPRVTVVQSNIPLEQLAQLLAEGKADVVLTGTGWQTQLEQVGIAAARKLGLPVASVLDHWVNYRERFGFPSDWISRLPNRVLVGDAYALAQARADGFPMECVVPVENPYLEDFASQADTLRASGRLASDCRRVLLLGEPLEVDFATGKSEIDLGADLISWVTDLILSQPDIRLVVRAHPSESLSRYDFLKQLPQVHRVELHRAADLSLDQDIASADIVVGMSSMALLAAAAAGRATIAFLPEGRSQGLPHSEIRCCRTPAEFLAALAETDNIPPPLELRLFKDSLPDVLKAFVPNVDSTP